MRKKTASWLKIQEFTGHDSAISVSADMDVEDGWLEACVHIFDGSSSLYMDTSVLSTDKHDARDEVDAHIKKIDTIRNALARLRHCLESYIERRNFNRTEWDEHVEEMHGDKR